MQCHNSVDLSTIAKILQTDKTWKDTKLFICWENMFEHINTSELCDIPTVALLQSWIFDLTYRVQETLELLRY